MIKREAVPFIAKHMGWFVIAAVMLVGGVSCVKQARDKEASGVVVMESSDPDVAGVYEEWGTELVAFSPAPTGPQSETLHGVQSGVWVVVIDSADGISFVYSGTEIAFVSSQGVTRRPGE